NNLEISIEFVVTIDGNSWTYPLRLTVKKPLVEISGVYINDLQGNSNGLAEPGETFNMIVNYYNEGSVDASNITSNITCLSEEVTITNPMQLLPMIGAGKISQAVYEITLSQNVVIGNNITFYLTFLGDQIDAQNEQLLFNVGTTGM